MQFRDRVHPLRKLHTMKQLMILSLALLGVFGSQAQNTMNPYPRTITVTGVAEREITPDQIYVNIQLREYQPKGGSKVNIDKIRTDFLKQMKTIGLPDTAITVYSYDGYNANPWLKKKKKDEDLLASITYQVILRNTAEIDKVVNVLDDQATASFNIMKTSHTQITSIQNDLKIAALRSAREKAQNLAAGLNSRVGVSITINEPNEVYQPIMYRAQMKVASDAADEVPNADFRKMKISYNVTVVFELI